LSQTGFLSHALGCGYASKSINGSKDVDFGLVFKIHCAKNMAKLFGLTEPGKHDRKRENVTTT